MKKSCKVKWIMVIILILLVTVTGCSSKNDSFTVEERKADKDYGYVGSVIETTMPDEMDNQENGNAMTSGGTNPLSGSTLPAGRKIIQNVSVGMETLEFDKTNQRINEIVYEFNGYIENSSIDGRRIQNSSRYDYRSADMTIRVPAQKLSIFLDELMGLGNVYNTSVGQEDVTFTYTDTEARIKSLEVQEERLLELLANGGDLEQLIMLENQLSDVRYRIESYKSNLMMLDNKVNYGTIHLYLQEVIEVTEYVEPPKTFAEKLSSRFVNSLKDVKNGFLGFILWFVATLPHLVVLAMFGLIIYWIVRFILKVSRKSDKKEVVIKEENKKE